MVFEMCICPDCGASHFCNEGKEFLEEEEGGIRVNMPFFKMIIKTVTRNNRKQIHTV